MIHDQINVAMKNLKGNRTLLLIIMPEINIVEKTLYSQRALHYYLTSTTPVND
jgi:hypothetical protein